MSADARAQKNRMGFKRAVSAGLGVRGEGCGPCVGSILGICVLLGGLRVKRFKVHVHDCICVDALTDSLCLNVTWGSILY